MLVEVQGIRCLTKMVLHSINPDDQPIWTFGLTYPRIIHAEFMTHRRFSRNASSSRAIPVAKMLERVRNDPAMPLRFGANQKGMQDKGQGHDQSIVIPVHLEPFFNQWRRDQAGGSYDNHDSPVTAEDAWRFSAWLMADMSEALSDAGYHKQIANRLTEFAQYISVVVTTTELDNYFELRDDAGAEPTIQELAQTMKQALAQSIAQPLGWGDWHLPYLTATDPKMPVRSQVESSSARCARVSYLTHEGRTPSLAEDENLYLGLVGSKPLHATPTEHPAQAIRGSFANFDGWCSHRWQIERQIRIVRQEEWI